ncbi:ester cyclase [Streptomyces sp. NPDC093589]|uniref:ester cyclase n=1 Tax=Streptomyces sp. NPDC093589 TaxID=3366043 RepID=UPI003805FE64
MKFVQVIDFKTDQIDGMNQLMDKWMEQTKGRRSATHSVVGKDRSDSSHFVEIVDFPSHEEAMKNSRLPETGQIFQEMVALCDGAPSFTDLDVVRDEQLNTAAARRFFGEIAVDGNLDAIDELFAPDYRDHDISKDVDATIGSAEIRKDVTGWRGAFDFTFTINRQISEGDDVVTLWSWTGTHRGEFMGIAATGKRCTMTGTTVFRFGDGRIQEGWWHYDIMQIMRTLGVLR